MQNEPTAPGSPPLTPRQLAACRLLLAGHALPAAAAQLGVSRQTLWRWSRLPAFAAELHRLHTALCAPRPAPDARPRTTPPLETRRPAPGTPPRPLASIFREFGFEPPPSLRDR